MRFLDWKKGPTEFPPRLWSFFYSHMWRRNYGPQTKWQVGWQPWKSHTPWPVGGRGAVEPTWSLTEPKMPFRNREAFQDHTQFYNTDILSSCHLAAGPTPLCLQAPWPCGKLRYLSLPGSSSCCLFKCLLLRGLKCLLYLLLLYYQVFTLSNLPRQRISLALWGWAFLHWLTDWEVGCCLNQVHATVHPAVCRVLGLCAWPRVWAEALSRGREHCRHLEGQSPQPQITDTAWSKYEGSGAEIIWNNVLSLYTFDN